MVDHKACPFCGGRSLRVKTLWDVYRFVACTRCNAAGPKADDEAGAWSAWDERKAPEPIQQGLF